MADFSDERQKNNYRVSQSLQDNRQENGVFYPSITTVIQAEVQAVKSTLPSMQMEPLTIPELAGYSDITAHEFI
jgi:hypothetical protein